MQSTDQWSNLVSLANPQTPWAPKTPWAPQTPWAPETPQAPQTIPFQSASCFQYQHTEEGSGDSGPLHMNSWDAIIGIKHAIFCIRHTHPTIPCWLHVV